MFKKLASLICAAGVAITTLAGAMPVQAATTTTAAATTATAATTAEQQLNASLAAAGLYLSELTGQPISTTIQNQRPIAVMIDNDKRSYPHYDVAGADIVYEMVNSMVNNRITRLMCVYKDWNNQPTMIGNIRSTRPTNVLTAVEYNAILCHDGGPFYINPYIKSTKIADLTPMPTRVKNGKASEFTEYIAAGDITRLCRQKGISTTYTANPGSHFNFRYVDTDLSTVYPVGVNSASTINLAGVFPNTQSALTYNAQTQTYDYSTFGSSCKDAGTNAQVTFKNVILQVASTHQYDKNGYLIYNCIGQGVGYYCTDGKYIPIIWVKMSETGKTQYFDAAGTPLQINPGKTYIGIVPQDTFANIAIQ